MKNTKRNRLLGLFLLIPTIIALLLGGCANKDNVNSDGSLPIMYKACNTPNGDTVYRYCDGVAYIYVLVNKEGKTINVAIH
jgi:hypothetical protein